MSDANSALVNWSAFAQAREELGAGFVRILGYFQEDGVKSVDAIEEAMRAKNAAALVRPAHTLKGEARQFGASPLAQVAEMIEMIARDCVESREEPDAALPYVVRLRDLFENTMSALQREASPLVARRPTPAAAPVFGRRAASSFGRAS
ncbi:Hpt domain-containing protein [Sphingomonas sp.]|uniref:Hpt domain-containing protein n=1 Tax=Sphingomonas sp. TaxID=28214 RepID=UPI0025F59518|nr:Hpt domain-containing protein [Sphingomonas sp.]